MLSVESLASLQREYLFLFDYLGGELFLGRKICVILGGILMLFIVVFFKVTISYSLRIV